MARHTAEPDGGHDRVRLDKWLWAARFYKTRSLAAEAIDKGRVKVNGQVAKASREPKPGDEIRFIAGDSPRTVIVRALSAVRGPAPVAALLYEETAESVQQRQLLSEQRRLAPEPSHTLTQGRPTKRDRRRLQDWSAQAPSSPPPWNERWSASIDHPER